MRITMVIHSLSPGGAERVMVLLANGLLTRKHQITICTLGFGIEDCIYPLDPGVGLLPLGLNRLPQHKGRFWTLLHVFELIRGLRRHLRTTRPDVVIAFITETNIFTLHATLGLGIPTIISERCDPAITPLRRLWKVARQLTYPLASALVVQSEEVRAWFSPLIRRRTRVISNPVLPAPRSRPDQGHTGPSRRLIAVGRLVHQKGFDLLLEAFGRLASAHPEWILEIWGEGPLRRDLEALRDRLGLQSRVSFPGLTEDIHARYAQADMFVLSSRYEGFPNALCEAMANGLAVVATSCSGGVRDILRPGVDGLLVPPDDVDALERALGEALTSAALRAALGSQAKCVVERFGLDSILDGWEACMRPVAWRKPGPANHDGV